MKLRKYDAVVKTEDGEKPFMIFALSSENAIRIACDYANVPNRLRKKVTITIKEA